MINNDRLYEIARLLPQFETRADAARAMGITRQRLNQLIKKAESRGIEMPPSRRSAGRKERPERLPCASCGGPITQPVAYKYCSELCHERGLARYMRVCPNPACPHPGGVYRTRHKHQKYCCSRCSAEHRLAMGTFVPGPKKRNAA